MSVEQFYADNRTNWNDRARVHAGSELYRLDQMDEHEGTPWQFVSSCVREGELWYLPEPLRSRVPGLFSLEATKS